MMAERRYLASHPWLDFELDLRAVRPDLWIELGEIVRGAGSIREMPVHPVSYEGIKRKAMARGLHGSAALEGNLIELDEVEAILDPEKPAPGFEDDRVDGIHGIRAVLSAIDLRLSEHSGADELHWDISPEDISSFAYYLRPERQSGERPGPPRPLLPRGVPQNQQASGASRLQMPYRTAEVQEMAYRGAPPEDCSYLLGRLCTGLSEIRKGFPSANDAVSGILRGIFAHAYVAWIMPFGECDCLTARTVEYQVMRSGGIPSPVVMLLGWYYNRTSRDYTRLLGRSSAGKGELLPFVEYVLTGLTEAVRDLGSVISSSQEEIIWERNILDALGVSSPNAGRSSKISMRRRILMEDISRAGGPVRVSGLLGLSSRVARAYSDTSGRTLARDVDELIGLGLLERDKRTLRPRRSSIRPERTED